MRSGPNIVTGVSIAVGTGIGMGSLWRWGICCDDGFFCRRRPIWIPSENALICRLRFTGPPDALEEWVVEADVFLLCFDDRTDCAEYEEFDVFDAFEDARERERSSTEVAGEESAEK